MMVVLAIYSRSAIAEAVRRFEKKHNGPYPHRREELKAVRPAK
jgi:hypothetical protein